MTATVVHRDGATALVEIAGEIDVHTVGELRTILLALADEGRSHIVADFTGVRFCDAAGLGMLVAVNNRVAECGGALRLVGVRPAQRRILEITRLDRLFEPHDGAGDALTP
jgi:anti-sigma B factor antagonist